MLGLVANGKRAIKSGAQYDALFDVPCEGKEVELLADGDVHDTIKLMKRVVSKTLPQTKGIARELKGSSRMETCRNVWNFLYNHIQYKKDHPMREQLRTPSRSWRDRKKGIDCDCYSIFISSILTNLSIPHAFRMAGYKGDFQHVYVVVPAGSQISSSRDSYIVIDPVVNKFNYEEPFNKKSDSMSSVTMLNGLGACNPVPLIDRLTTYVPTQQVIAGGGVVTRDHLEANGIPYAPVFDKEKNQPMYAVCLDSGMTLLPTVLTPDQAALLKPGAQTAASVPVSDTLTDKAKKLPWLWIAAIVVGGIILVTGDDQKEVKSGLEGLAGVKAKAKTKKKKRAVKVISI